MRDEITGVQYLRGLAAIAVVLDHSAGMAALDKYHGGSLAGGLLLHGGRGVDLFFLISGFIIAIVSLKGPDLAPALGVRAFFVRRFTRIVPLMWIAIVAFALLRITARGVWDGEGYLRALTLWPWGRPIPTHIWTLRQELLFYLVFAAAMLTAPRWRLLMIAWIVGPFLFAALAPISMQRLGWPVALLLNWRNLEFAVGLALAWLWLRGSRELRIRLPIDPLPVLTGLVLLALFVLIPVTGLGPGLWMALLFAPILFLAVHAECPAGPLRWFGEMLGNASYSIYLFHPPVISAMLGLWVRLAPATPLWLMVAGCAVGSTAVGVGLHFVLERPLIAALRRRVREAPLRH